MNILDDMGGWVNYQDIFILEVNYSFNYQTLGSLLVDQGKLAI